MHINEKPQINRSQRVCRSCVEKRKAQWLEAPKLASSKTLPWRQGLEALRCCLQSSLLPCWAADYPSQDRVEKCRRALVGGNLGGRHSSVQVVPRPQAERPLREKASQQPSQSLRASDMGPRWILVCSLSNRSALVLCPIWHVPVRGPGGAHAVRDQRVSGVVSERLPTKTERL